MRRLSFLLAGIVGLLIAACEERIDTLEDLQAGGELIILTRNAPTITYVGPFRQQGPEHDLAVAFAESLGLEPRFAFKDTVADLLAGLERGEGHIAAAGLTRTADREARYAFGADYKQVREQVVCHREGPRPATPADLVGINLFAIAESSYIETLSELASEVPGLTWREDTERSTEELLAEVAAGTIACVVADSTIVAINRRYHPELRVAMDLTGDRPLAWIVADHVPVLVPLLDAWFAEIRADGTLRAIDDRYYAFVDLFDPGGAEHFHGRIDDRLPSLRAVLEQAAAETDLPWEVLAAVAYQESHWDPLARSPTGVRGVMMLTRATAKELGVSDRLNPQQSVRGGARYIRHLMDRLPETVVGENRLWIALAAYNIGLGHVWDARKLARQLGHDPETWEGLEQTLPLLSKKQYRHELKYGYARGSGAVAYVRRVRNFADILARKIRAEAT